MKFFIPLWRSILVLSLGFVMTVTASVRAPSEGANQPSPGLAASDTLLGAPVRSTGGFPVGSVAAVLVETGSGRIAYLLIAAAPGRDILVPWRAVHRAPGGGAGFLLSVDAERFRHAPFGPEAFRRPETEAAIHRYFGVSPYWQDPPPAGSSPPSPPRGLRIVR